MSKSTGIKAITQFIGLLLCMLLMQTAFAAGNTTADNELIGNATDDNTTTENTTVNPINPSDYSAYLSAGGSIQSTVTFTNGGNEALILTPKVVTTPDSQNSINENWITISPTNATVAPGSVQNFNIEINVPRDVESGYYQGTIAFTNDLVPNSTQYVNSMQLGISVQAQSKIELQSSYISDNVEAGKEYEYQIKIKNVAENDITIGPTLNNYNQEYEQVFDNDAIEISAPLTIKSGEVTNMTIRVHVPENATGSYNGYIDINVDGKINDGSTPQIGLSFNVWQQPVIPYEKTFSTNTNAPITIEVSTDNYDSAMGLRTLPKNNGPSFDLGLIHNSVPVNMTFVKSIESGSVNIGSNYPMWAMKNGNIYQNNNDHYVETYTVPGAIGNWKLTILPKNTNNFGYSITKDSNSAITGNTTPDDTMVDNTTADNTTQDNATVETNQLVTETDNGKCINLTNGETFYLKLKENPTTGYSWQLNLSQGLRLLSDEFTTDKFPGETEVPCGRGGTHLWEIKAVTPGSQQIKGISKQPWMETIGTEENFTLRVEVI